MHITLLTIGSRGDIQPFIALGVALLQAGVNVRLATHQRFQPLAAQYNLNFAPIHSDPLEILNTPEGQAWIHSGKNPISLITNMVRLGRPVFQQLTQDVTAACRDTDLIVYTIFGSVAYHLAEKQNIPAVMVNLQPLFGRRSAFAAPGAPQPFATIPSVSTNNRLGQAYNRFTYGLVQQVFWQPFRPLVQKWRRQTLQLPPAPFWGPYRQLHENKTATLHAYSPTVVPPDPDWPVWYHTTGYWQLPPPADWSPPADLHHFLQSSPTPPIYFGFGSMVDQEPQKLFTLISNALKKTNQRGIILRGWADLGGEVLPPHIHLISSTPHSWLFPRLSAIVHHGGAGTTASALTAGKPTLVVPYFADQHFWGDRVHNLGAGPHPIPRQQLTEENLTAALQQIKGSDTMQTKAASVGQTLQKENGAKRAANLLLNLYNNGG